jgi:hypothetical protein
MSVPVSRFSLGKTLLYLAAAYQATQYARAFDVIDPVSWWADIGGLMAGVVVNVSLAYSASRLPRLRSMSARRYSGAAFWALMTFTPLFLAPINYVTMGDLWARSSAVRWTLAIVSASVVDVAIVLLAFADGSLLPADDSQKTQTATQAAKPATQKTQTASQTAKPATQKTQTASQTAKTYVCEWPNCDAEFDKPQSYSAHISQHRRREAKIYKELHLENSQP